jgi:hypothetical protein
MNEMANIDIQIVFRVHINQYYRKTFRWAKIENEITASFSGNSIGFEAAEPRSCLI